MEGGPYGIYSTSRSKNTKPITIVLVVLTIIALIAIGLYGRGSGSNSPTFGSGVDRFGRSVK